MKSTLANLLQNKLVVKIIILATFGVAYIFMMKNIGNGSICLFRNWTGLPCPGCGLTHAGFALLKGNFVLAWHYNATIFIAIPLLITPFIKNSKIKTALTYLYILAITVILGYYVYRMVTIFPHGDYPMVITPNSILEQLINF